MRGGPADTAPRTGDNGDFCWCVHIVLSSFCCGEREFLRSERGFVIASAQRSNLVDSAPGWLEIAASPCGLLAMTRLHLTARAAAQIPVGSARRVRPGRQ